jgi:hypothetical protein
MAMFAPPAIYRQLLVTRRSGKGREPRFSGCGG